MAEFIYLTVTGKKISQRRKFRDEIEEVLTKNGFFNVGSGGDSHEWVTGGALRGALNPHVVQEIYDILGQEGFNHNEVGILVKPADERFLKSIHPEMFPE